MKIRQLIQYQLLSIGILLAINVSAQQLPTFINYTNNWSLLNPAAVSPDFLIDDYYRLSIQATYRQQWVGLEDAPQTQSLAVTWMPESNPILVGGQLLNDKTGAIGLTGAYGQLRVTVKDLGDFTHALPRVLQERTMGPSKKR